MNLSDSLTLNSHKGVYELKQNTLPQCAYLQQVTEVECCSMDLHILQIMSPGISEIWTSSIEQQISSMCDIFQ